MSVKYVIEDMSVKEDMNIVYNVILVMNVS